MNFKKATPVFVVTTIEPSLELWIDRLGFTKTVEVPHGAALGFVALEKDGIEIMYQSRASAQADTDAIDHARAAQATLFMEVDDVTLVRTVLRESEILVERQAPYGMNEIFIREAGGHVIGFASPIPG